jgi:hypothetical protein
MDPNIFMARMDAQKVAEAAARTLVLARDGMMKETTVNGLVTKRLEIHDLERARESFSPFAGSSDAEVAGTAKAFQAALDHLISAQKKSLELISKLDPTDPNARPGKLMADASEITFGMKIGWSGMQEAVGLLAKSLLLQTATQGQRLVLTKADRTALQTTLASLLNDAPAAADIYAIQQSGIRSTATTLRDFLALPWKAIDDE